MKLLELKCPKCGGKLQLDFGITTCVGPRVVRAFEVEYSTSRGCGYKSTEKVKKS